MPMAERRTEGQSTPCQRSRLGVPQTPAEGQREVYRYYCPICMWHYKSIFKTVCCAGQYICEFCVLSMLRSRQGSLAAPDMHPHGFSMGFPCPFCCADLVIAAPKANETVRVYHESPCPQPRHPSRSPLKVGESFEDLKRKLVSFAQVGYQAPPAPEDISSLITDPPSSASQSGILASQAPATPPGQLRTALPRTPPGFWDGSSPIYGGRARHQDQPGEIRRENDGGNRAPQRPRRRPSQSPPLPHRIPRTPPRATRELPVPSVPSPPPRVLRAPTVPASAPSVAIPARGTAGGVGLLPPPQRGDSATVVSLRRQSNNQQRQAVVPPIASRNLCVVS
eukprot:TRINITY_DN6387_c0_g1_i1.p1 TRINITY_DN6387_c0_g1~~TRINITY_DN6387_c0_g1_i1.p1  ORF type:complete len:337 (-),score=11.74 TRINITY_DN6387_c0_g1_i1:63-1073(-)